MRKFTFILLGLACCNLQLSAQTRTQSASSRRLVREYQKKAASVINNMTARLDSLRLDTVPGQADSVSSTMVVFPYLYQLVGPPTYYSSAISRRFLLDWDLPSQHQPSVLSEGMAYRDRLVDAIDDVLVTNYMNHPAAVKFYDKRIEQEQLVENADIVAPATSDLDNILNQVNGAADVTDVAGPMDIGLKIERPNFWKTSGKFGLQFTQNYFSDNWYKGGNNNVTLLSSLTLEANYNDQQRVQWDNKLEMRLGFVTVPSDTVHKFLTNNDKIYLFSKLGVKAFENFFYTVQAEAQTQFMPGYKSNDTTAYSRFLAPLDVYVSIGMDYKPKLKNGNSLSVALLPLSYKLRYIHNGDDVIIKAYKIRDQLRCQNDFGSKIEFSCNLKILKNFSWRSRFYYFTTYKYVEGELENVLSFSFNKYISAELYTLWRFDDNRDMKYWDDSLGFFQFKEFFTLGLAYNF
ncbi:MAG: DUF3078 domain-containing protein [Bacteroidaceae bacterium]|nr:DUF3078 domain-containing protein [Bacteroidaceae bacterium]